jgi:hypothetical protein
VYIVYASCKVSINKLFRKNVVLNLLKLIENEEFKRRSKAGCMGAFIRERILTFKVLIVIISRGLKNSLQRELDSFYKEVYQSEFNIREVTKGAFTQARSKLRHEAFIEMNDNINQTFYTEAPYLLWNTYRLLACDGSRLVLPKHKSIIEEFGEHGFGPDANSKQSLAVTSLLYDVLNLVTIDAQIAPYIKSERELLYEHLKKVQQDDLLLLDRGYPSIALMFLLRAKGINFCMRMKEDWWLSIKEFAESFEKERIVSFSLPKKDRELLKEYSYMYDQKIECRLVCVELENGEKEILCTSLTDFEKYPYSDFGELYNLRWGVEEAYKLYKSRAEIENFSGKTALAVKQDFFAMVFTMSLCAILAFPIEERVRKEYQEAENKPKREKKINRTSALSMLRNISIGLFLKNRVTPALSAFDKIVSKTTEIVRPGRKFKRYKKHKKPYYMNYKPLGA